MAKSNFIVRGGADFSKIKSELDKTQKNLKSFQSNIKGIMGKVVAVFGTIAIGNLIKDSARLALETEGAVNRISRSMGSSAKEFSNWAETQAQSFGMAKSEAMKYGAVYGNLISGFSRGTKDTTKLTVDLLKASAIVASSTGRTMEDTMERIRSGLMGNTEAIEDLGVYAHVGMLETTNAFKQIAGDRSWNQLEFQEMQQIRLMGILEQVNTKFGDKLADTSMAALQRYRAELQNAKLALGQAFMPILQIVLPILTKLAKALAVAATELARFISLVTGKEMKVPTAAIEDASTAQEDLSTNIENTGAAAKKTLKTLAGFDEINTIGGKVDDTVPTGGGITPGGGISPLNDVANAFKEMGKVVEEMSNLEKAYYDVLEYIDPNEIENKKISVDNLKKSLSELGQTIQDITGLKPINWSKLLGNLINAKNTGLSAYNTQLKGIVDYMNSALKRDWSGVFDSISTITQGFAKEFVPFLELIGADGLAKKIKELTSPVKDLTNLTKGLSERTSELVTKFNKNFNSLDTTIKMINWSDKVITAGDVNNVKNRLDAVTSSVFENLAATKEEALKNINDLYQQGLLTEAEKNEQIQKTKEYFDKQEQKVSSSQNRIIEIYDNAKQKNVKLTEQQKNEIMRLMDTLQTSSVETMTTSANEQTLILERLKNNASKLTAYQTVEMVKNAEEAKEGVVKAANQQYLDEVAIIEYQRDVIGSLSEEEADKKIEEAKRARDKTVSEAETQYKNILEEAKNHTKDMKNQIDWEKKELRTPWDAKWTELKDTAKEKLNQIKTNWAITWAVMKDKFETEWKNIKDAIKKPINGIIDIINALIDRMNDFGFEIPDALKGAAEKLGIDNGKVGFNIDRIPRLAQGGFFQANSPTLAMVGDNTREGEIVAPESKIYEQVMKALSTAGGKTEIVLQLGTHEIFRTIIEGINAEQRRAGKMLFNI